MSRKSPIPYGSGNVGSPGSPTTWSTVGTDKSALFTLSGGNLQWDSATNVHGLIIANVALTMGPGGGKWYCEFDFPSGQYMYVGIGFTVAAGLDVNNYPGHDNESWGYYSANNAASSNIQTTRSPINPTYGAGWTTGQKIGMAIDCENVAVYFRKNGVWQSASGVAGVPTSGAAKIGAAPMSGLASGMVVYACTGNADSAAASQCIANFGGTPFTYPPPYGYNYGI